jgi:hypothetical protein
MAKNIHRLLILDSLAFNQSMNRKTPFTIAQSHIKITANEAINSHICGMHSNRNQNMKVMIDITKSILL